MPADVLLPLVGEKIPDLRSLRKLKIEDGFFDCVTQHFQKIVEEHASALGPFVEPLKPTPLAPEELPNTFSQSLSRLAQTELYVKVEDDKQKDNAAITRKSLYVGCATQKDAEDFALNVIADMRRAFRVGLNVGITFQIAAIVIILLRENAIDTMLTQYACHWRLWLCDWTPSSVPQFV